MEKMNRRQFLRFISATGLSACALTTETRAREGMDKPIWDWGRLPPRVFKDKTEGPSIVGTSNSQNPFLINESMRGQPLTQDIWFLCRRRKEIGAVK